ncbi:MAG: DUF1553 domain-containing protein, partial [Planctomycetes bacterium]|nr:DUF1553 domain-containing protein [Planctomycetota bacterium]
IAGDELANFQPNGPDITPEQIELLEATHFIRNSPDGTDSSDGNADEQRADRYAVLEGELQIIGSALMGITVQCARCHDHKFEPFRQRDYYQLQAVLFPAFNVDQWVNPKQRFTNAGTVAQNAAFEKATQQIDEQIATLRNELRTWQQSHREKGRIVFSDQFDHSSLKLSERWDNKAPGDVNPAGQPIVNIDSDTAPGAIVADGGLRIIESGGSGDRACITKQVFDWTPDVEGAWIQVSFDLVKGSEYVGYFIALRDFDDSRDLGGGNILFDGAKSGGVRVHVDYPGIDSRFAGAPGKLPYVDGKNYGVRCTNIGNGKYEIAHLVDGLAEDGPIKLDAADLPDGGFGFEYCCGRSFAIDNVLIEAGKTSPEAIAKRKETVELFQKKKAEHDAAVKEIEAKRPQHPGMIAAALDLAPQQPDVYLLEQGLYKQRKEKVEPRAPEFLSDEGNSATLRDRSTAVVNSTGNRLALARWITAGDSRSSGLLARVTVNRWWGHHFGTGIVATPDNLGYSGSLPTHPELLEYLATEFIRSGWSAKTVHRLIVNSATYRQSSRFTDRIEQIDPSNQWLSRFPLRRLDAESIRDSMLAVSGELDFRMTGTATPSTRDAEGDVTVSESQPGARRRSVYLQQRRTQVPGLLEVFDAPSIVANCTMRIPTTIPLQSLKLLNSEFVRLRATSFADRVLASKANGLDEQIERAFELCVARHPTVNEKTAAVVFLKSQPQEYREDVDSMRKAWIDFASLLLSTNAFLYVE